MSLPELTCHVCDEPFNGELYCVACEDPWTDEHTSEGCEQGWFYVDGDEGNCDCATYISADGEIATVRYDYDRHVQLTFCFDG